MNIFKYIKLLIREFIGLENDYESLIINQEKILQSLEKFENREVENSTNELRMVLQPLTFTIRRNLRNRLENQINNSEINRLPYLNRIENSLVIDNETIMEINHRTSSERRIEFMQNVINQKNINDNSVFLITQSTNYVRNLHDLLIRSASNMNINGNDLYRVGNIFLYTIANLNKEGLVIKDYSTFIYSYGYV